MSKALNAVFTRVNRKRYWYELPTTSLRALNLLSLRLDLRDKNLFDAGTKINEGPEQEPPPEAKAARRPDGKWNDLRDPEMGSAGTEFGRNIKPDKYKPEKPPKLYDPNPREVSLQLMTRDYFKPAETLNVLAAAWIQFENHNWFFHGRGKEDEVMEVPLPEGDDWPTNPMYVRRTVSTPAHQGGSGGSGSLDGSSNGSNGSRSAVHGNTETHWWDGSQIYGTSKETQDKLRSFKDGKVKIQDNGRLFPDPNEPGLDL